MENKQQRVLAYQVASSISLDDLDRISGGAGPQMSTKQTFKPSGNSATGPDIVYDVSADW